MNRTRKLEEITILESSLLQYINRCLGRSGGLKLFPQRGLLIFCLRHSFNLHAIVLAQTLINCQEFNNLYKAWSMLIGSKFLETQEKECKLIQKFLINESNLYKLQ